MTSIDGRAAQHAGLLQGDQYWDDLADSPINTMQAIPANSCRRVLHESTTHEPSNNDRKSALLTDTSTSAAGAAIPAS